MRLYHPVEGLWAAAALRGDASYRERFAAGVSKRALTPFGETGSRVWSPCAAVRDVLDRLGSSEGAEAVS